MRLYEQLRFRGKCVDGIHDKIGVALLNKRSYLLRCEVLGHQREVYIGLYAPQLLSQRLRLKRSQCILISHHLSVEIAGGDSIPIHEGKSPNPCANQ